MLVAQKIAHLLSGVSQRPAVQRHVTQLTSATNVFGSMVLGLMKRPATDFIKLLTATTTGWDTSSFVHTIIRNDNDRYSLVVVNGRCTMYDENGTAVVVTNSTGDADPVAYLTDAGANGFRAVTVGDSTFIINRGITCAMTTDKSARQTEELFVYVRQADYDTGYAIVLDGEEFTITTDEGADSSARGAISTELIAESFVSLINGSQFLRWVAVQYGSLIHIRRSNIISGSNQSDIQAQVEDGLGDKGLLLIRGEVESVEDLPRKCKHGTVLKVTGLQTTKKDDYYVKYFGQVGKEAGFWEETVAPGILTTIDASTMPVVVEAVGITIEKAACDGPSSAFLGSWEPALSMTEQGEYEYGWDLDQDGAEVIESEDDILRDGTEERRMVLDDADGKDAEVRVKVDVDTSLVENGVTTIVELVHYDGAETVLETIELPPGKRFTDLEMSGDLTAPANTESLRLKLKYSTPDTPLTHRRAQLTAAGKTTSPRNWRDPVAPITLTVPQYADITYPSAITYPFGTKVEVKVNSIAAFQYSVPSGGKTAAEVTTAMQGLINADGTLTATVVDTYTVRVSLTAANYDTPTINTKTRLDGLTFWNDGIGVVADAFIGATLLNYSDGSTGTITDNDTESFVVASMTGGADNDIQPGDILGIREAGVVFTMKRVDWQTRQAGDDTTNKQPSFIGQKLTEIFFFRNRLCFTSGENLIMSGTGNLFDFWRNSVVDILVDDRIDVKSASASGGDFHKATYWNNDLYLWSDSAQFLLSGEPVLSAETISLNQISSYFNTPSVPPVVAGDVTYFCHATRGNGRVFSYHLPPEADSEAPPKAFDMTIEIPTYISGEPEHMAVDEGLGILVMVTDTDADTLYVFSWTNINGEVAQAGWFKWDLPLTSAVHSLTFIDGKLRLIVKRADGIFLEEIDMNISVTPDDIEQVSYLDRRITEDDCSDVTYAASDTVFTLPYEVNIDQTTQGELAIYLRDGAFTKYTVTRAAAGTATVAGVDLSAANVYIGILYTARARLSPVYKRDREDVPETRGRLQLHRIDFHYHDTTELKIEVTPPGRSKQTTTITQQDPADGTQRAGVHCQGERAIIELVADGAGGFRIGAADWEGTYKNRARRA